MSNLKNIQRKISEGVSGWLLFEFHCFRGYLFNEKYLSYPLGQVLNSITEFKTRSEINHPCSNAGRGRPLQIDFVLTDKENNWKYSFESKWIGNTTISQGSVIWDLIRLQNLFYHHPKVKCYFVLAGFEKKINLLLQTLEIYHDENAVSSGSITDVNSTFLTFNLFKLDDATKNYLNNKVDSYPNMILYSRIHCRPAHRFPKSDMINMSFSTYTFEVLKPDKTQKIKKLE